MNKLNKIEIKTIAAELGIKLNKKKGNGKYVEKRKAELIADITNIKKLYINIDNDELMHYLSLFNKLNELQLYLHEDSFYGRYIKEFSLRFHKFINNLPNGFKTLQINVERKILYKNSFKNLPSTLENFCCNCRYKTNNYLPSSIKLLSSKYSDYKVFICVNNLPNSLRTIDIENEGCQDMNFKIPYKLKVLKSFRLRFNKFIVPPFLSFSGNINSNIKYIY